MTVIRSLTALYSRRRFACLFVSLLLTMVAAPVFGAMGLSTRLMEVVLVLNILAAALITLFSFRRYVGLGLFALLLAVKGAHALLGYGPLAATSQGIGVLICLMSAGIMIRYILSEGAVTSERIFAALDVHLLIGIVCGLLFCIFEEEWPGSVSFQGAALVGSKQNLMAHTVYFSFVTLGTLGYGDIIPIGGPARALAVTEAIIGQMYLVVIVARLVSLYKTPGERSERDQGGNTIDPDEPMQS